MSEVIDRFGRVDGLVNNAGQTLRSVRSWRSRPRLGRRHRTDLTAAFHTCRAALPSMLERGSGSIVNIASRLGQMGVTETAAYSAAKAGLIGLTRALAREFGTRGIRVNAVAPGVTITEMTTDLVDSEAGRNRLRDVPLGRFGRADEVADAVIFLLSDASTCSSARRSTPTPGATCREQGHRAFARGGRARHGRQHGRRRRVRAPGMRCRSGSSTSSRRSSRRRASRAT